MSQFDEIWERALRDAARGLADRGANPSDVRETVDKLRRINFPGALSLLGKGGGQGKVGDELLRAAAVKAAEQPALSRRGIDAGDAERMLKALWIHRQNPRELLQDEDVLTLLVEVAGRELANEGVAVRPEEARKALQLLATGEFFNDLAGTTAAVLHTVPRLPLAIAADVPRTPFRLAQLAQAVILDLGGVGFRIPSIVEDILDGTLDNPPGVMTHTLRWMYGLASAKSLAEMMRSLLDPRNESLRLALVIYARSNGVPLEPEHLDVIRTTAFNTDAPDLGPLLVVGLAELRKRYGQDGLERMLGRMVQ